MVKKSFRQACYAEALGCCNLYWLQNPDLYGLFFSLYRCKVIPQKYWPIGYMHVCEEKMLAPNEIFAVDEQLYSNFHFIKGSFFSGTTNSV